eukprot:Gregarina_sp_Poly_1__2927@NODE_1819_length_3275_cov_85_079177_g1180_i0_p2_GENE_NODE_1819_length_3275_cov_85_079177_g1180_i0NODE_1819_length_3275_cov_85_079177_g1180_i0_p2_ORF_typecomplete_len266_score29_73Fboxlike/PF12937_7/0_00022Fbox/PF00646_33/0_15_NODE_1819_length_3275_cov_85_079177_g1180_i07241521
MFVADSKHATILERICLCQLWVQVFKRLDLIDLFTISQSCRYFHELLNTQDRFWKQLLQARHGIANSSTRFGLNPYRFEYVRLTHHRQSAYYFLDRGPGEWQPNMAGGNSLNTLLLRHAPYADFHFVFRNLYPGIYSVTWRIALFVYDGAETLPFYVKSHRSPLEIQLTPEELESRRVKYAQSKYDEKLLCRFDLDTSHLKGALRTVEFPLKFALHRSDNLETGILDHNWKSIWGINLDWVEVRRTQWHPPDTCLAQKIRCCCET